MTEDSRFDGKDSEFDGKAWWETDGGSKYFDIQTFITHTRTIWDIWHKANLLHFFRVHHSPGRRTTTKGTEYFDMAREWGYRWFDGISRRFDCVCYIPRISLRSQWFLSTCGSRLLLYKPDWQWDKPIFIYASPLNILGIFFLWLNIELNPAVTCPF